jgi:hypothetical protein
MDNRNTFIIAGVLVVALIAFAGIMLQRSEVTMAPGSSDDSAWQDAPAAELVEEVVSPSRVIVTAKHAYRAGVHTIAGEIPLPTPCHVLESSAIAAEDGSSIQVQFVSRTGEGEICAQVITPARFKLTAKANQKATFTGTFNGSPVTLNLIEAGPDEDLDAFELYIKG